MSDDKDEPVIILDQAAMDIAKEMMIAAVRRHMGSDSKTHPASASVALATHLAMAMRDTFNLPVAAFMAALKASLEHAGGVTSDPEVTVEVVKMSPGPAGEN